MQVATLVMAVTLFGCAPRGIGDDAGVDGIDVRGGVPQPDREFRAVWVATVDNIDWPSRPGLDPDSRPAGRHHQHDRTVDLG